MSTTGTMVRVSQNGNVMTTIELQTIKEIVVGLKQRIAYEEEVGYFPDVVRELRDVVSTLEMALAHYNFI